MIFLKQFLQAFVQFIVFDFIWLGFVVKDFNLRQLADIGRIENGDFSLHYGAAGAVYVFMALAVPFFILPRISEQDGIVNIFLTGALMGLIIYGVFDMTNLAILKNYPPAFILPDMAWGAFVFGLVSVITAKLSK